MQIIYWLLIAVMVVGVIGAVVPAIPGTSLILIAIIIWGVVSSSFAAIKIPLIVTVIVLLLSIGVDFLAGYIGAKQAGASKWGQIGAFVGLLLGFFGLLPALPFGGPLLGILMGPLLGAIIGEYLYQRQLGVAIKAGIGIVVGTVVGNLLQGILAIAAVVVFIVNTWPQIYGS
ncbi:MULTISPECIES: DUF456 domain-containing protein [unclassified Tolypothrix]|uniref:DUF456 domain-containing protein n=1 Tax=unclassified Tolypothrix TaxID=2649714 RepID=UPI0005EAB892|nr:MULTISPECIES: DUF456 family protein [unclassified Tolypothrix]BAY91673.1 hypothetical protein NIES3275_36980 [Microchaete diplosiphon NIES-3275]EKF05206.1 hypothetical protein FDUTEX481_01376 [Tolypothrix sp. PCC 7601]MBE9085839.1 DUF456 family protein [Tolypothrix sp. LEGE 11397]UYD25690.1 DUF456 family protein [Tolypothrix sp. PCC 7712]UYD32070.1 DUF456 family protein [Tolypothrix sp. PCC 7601]